MLHTYLKQVQRLIRDANQELINPADIVDFINRARRETAMRSQAIRVLPPVQAAVATITVNSGGTGYTAPVVTISPPDFPPGTQQNPLGSQATAVATVMGGVINNIDVTYGGAGYFQPIVTITDATGTGAQATALTAPAFQTQNGQEIYNFSSVDLSTFPGVKEIIAVRSVSVIYANYRYSLPQYSFTTYQAKIRQYPIQYSYVPTMCAQFGQGASGSLFLYPIASQAYQIELDCACWPMDLLTDQDYEALPDPWTDAVPFLATHFCYLELQNLNAAAYYRKLYDDTMAMHRGAATLGRRVNPYGRY